MKRLIQGGKQVGTIYHFTNCRNLIGILDEDCLKDKEQWGGISFTRNKNFMGVSRNLATTLNCYITIDGDRLSDKYKIEPYNYFRHKRKGTQEGLQYDEDEEVIKESEVSPIKPYITSIQLCGNQIDRSSIHGVNYKNNLHLNDIDELKSYIEEISGIPVYII